VLGAVAWLGELRVGLHLPFCDLHREAEGAGVTAMSFQRGREGTGVSDLVEVANDGDGVAGRGLVVIVEAAYQAPGEAAIGASEQVREHVAHRMQVQASGRGDEHV
jgi:hypothetical protein